MLTQIRIYSARVDWETYWRYWLGQVSKIYSIINRPLTYSDLYTRSEACVQGSSMLPWMNHMRARSGG